MEASVGGVRICISKGDITEVDTDAVVNAANDHFWMGGGVAGALKRAGGGNIETEAMSQGPVSVGQAVVTAAGTLPARYVIHAAVMGQDLVTSSDAIQEATRSSLERAEALEITSIAFPAFGTGVGGFPPGESAAAMIGASVDFLRSAPDRLERVEFILFSDELREAFEKKLAAILPSS